MRKRCLIDWSVTWWYKRCLNFVFFPLFCRQTRQLSTHSIMFTMQTMFLSRLLCRYPLGISTYCKNHVLFMVMWVFCFISFLCFIWIIFKSWSCRMFKRVKKDFLMSFIEHLFAFLSHFRYIWWQQIFIQVELTSCSLWRVR